MAAFDFEAFATEVVEAVSQSVKPLKDRISELEKQLAERLGLPPEKWSSLK